MEPVAKPAKLGLAGFLFFRKEVIC